MKSLHEPTSQVERPPYADASLGELFSRFARDVGLLVRQEAQLGRKDFVHGAKEASREIGLIAGGGILAHIGLLALVTGVVLALGRAMPYWGAALLVGAVLVGAGIALIMIGRKRLQRVELAPNRTIESVKKTALVIREREPGQREAH